MIILNFFELKILSEEMATDIFKRPIYVLRKENAATCDTKFVEKPNWKVQFSTSGYMLT